MPKYGWLVELEYRQNFPRVHAANRCKFQLGYTWINRQSPCYGIYQILVVGRVLKGLQSGINIWNLTMCSMRSDYHGRGTKVLGRHRRMHRALLTNWEGMMAELFRMGECYSFPIPQSPPPCEFYLTRASPDCSMQSILGDCSLIMAWGGSAN